MNQALASEKLLKTREQVADRAEAMIDDGSIFSTLSRRIARRTLSTNLNSDEELLTYLEEEMEPELKAMGFECELLRNTEFNNPMLIGRRIEDPRLPTIFGYGHGDVVEAAPEAWSEGLDPWLLTERHGAWYGRGIVDNKGQHTINLAAMRSVLEARGRLGFNAIWLIEMGEEIGSPGLRETCRREANKLAGDILLASDGPRVSAARPTVYLGTRGAVNFTLSINHRESSHHSGNWGGLLANPAIQLSHALSSITSATGKIKVEGWTPAGVPEDVRLALSTIEVNADASGPAIDPKWGEPGLSAAEQLFGWSSFDVLAMTAGDPVRPVNAVPPAAHAHCQLRTVVGVDETKVMSNLRAHLDDAGFPMVAIHNDDIGFRSTRLNPDDPWVQWVCSSIVNSSGKKPAVLPNIGGSLPNDAFSELLGMKTIWVPHSYPGAQNHGGDENLPVSIVREAMRIMASLYWELGDASSELPPL